MLRVINTKKQIPLSSPFVSFGRTGIVLLNKTAMRVMKLSSGDFIEFAQDDQNEEDWFIRKCKKSHFKLRHNTDKSLICAAQEVCISIKEATQYPRNRTVQYGVVEQPNEDGWHLILTAKAKIIEK